jgi:CRISPR-associated protein Cmr6
MPIAAVPNYLGQDFHEASPGLRFSLYLSIWTDRKDQEEEIRKRSEAKSHEGQRIKALIDRKGTNNAIAMLTDPTFSERERLKRLHALFSKNDFASRKAWESFCKLGGEDQDAMRALLTRQRAAFAARADAQAGLCLEAEAIAPFTTGLGNEHPLENGFAFLNPYGLPYLPGSGVKGVIRRAAQELADGMWEDSHGWSHELRYSIEVGSGKDKRTIPLSMLDALFGREPPSGDSDHVRGALTFWDVIPQIAGNSLMVEIMTPHQSHYYQQKPERKSGDSTNPHDSGQPTPISFLTVPPGSRFVFHVVCDTAHLERLAPELAEADETGAPRWKALIEAAFDHAFAWLGFGAKTAVGYGAMARPSAQQAPSAGQAPTAGAAATQATEQAPLSQATESVWPDAKLTFNPGTGEIKAIYAGKTTAGVKGDAAQKLLAELGERADKLKKAKELKNVPVRVRIEGNLTELLGLATDS